MPPPPFLCFYFKRSETNGANIFSLARARAFRRRFYLIFFCKIRKKIKNLLTFLCRHSIMSYRNKRSAAPAVTSQKGRE